jgi:hypothetical protein
LSIVIARAWRIGLPNSIGVSPLLRSIATKGRVRERSPTRVCIQSNLHLTWASFGVNSTRGIDGLDDLKLLRGNSEGRARRRSRDHWVSS